MIEDNNFNSRSNNNSDIKSLIEKIKGLTEIFDKIFDEKPLIVNKTEGCLYPVILSNTSSNEIFKLLTSTFKPDGAKYVSLDVILKII